MIARNEYRLIQHNLAAATPPLTIRHEFPTRGRFAVGRIANSCNFEPALPPGKSCLYVTVGKRQNDPRVIADPSQGGLEQEK